MSIFWNFSYMAVASSLDDANISILSIYLVKDINDGLMDSARRSSWSIYEIASMPDILDPIDSLDVCRYFRCK